MLFLSLLCVMSFQTILGVWISLFFSTLATVVFLVDLDYPSLALKYFLVQEVFTGLAIFSLVYDSDWFLFSLALFLKLAVPPFHTWFLKILFSSNADGWLLGFSKLIPTLWLFILQLSSALFLLLILLQVIFALLDVVTVKGVMFLSSCLNLYWGIILAQVNINYGLIWVFTYSYITYIFLTISSLVWQDVLVITGLPPSILFFIKVYFVITFDSSFLLLVGFLVSTFTLFISYLSVLEYTSMSDKMFSSPIFSLNLYSMFVLLVCLLLFSPFSFSKNVALTTNDQPKDDINNHSLTQLYTQRMTWNCIHAGHGAISLWCTTGEELQKIPKNRKNETFYLQILPFNVSISVSNPSVLSYPNSS